MTQEEKQVVQERKSHWMGWLPFALVAVLLLAGLALFVAHRVEQEQTVRRQQAANEKLGLPVDYPGQLIPVYPGVAILKAEKSAAKSKDGQAMDKWYIHATSPDNRDKLHDFYVDIANKLGLSQTMGIQIPSGYGTNYANDKLEVDFVIEVRPPDKLTHLEISLFVVKGTV